MAWTSIFRSKKVSADGPTDNAEWVPVGNFSHLNVKYSVSTPGGTNPYLRLYVEYTDDNTATTGIKAVSSEIDFHDTSDDVLVSEVPVQGRFARVQRDIEGTSPEYVLDVSAVAY